MGSCPERNGSRVFRCVIDTFHQVTANKHKVITLVNIVAGGISHFMNERIHQIKEL